MKFIIMFATLLLYSPMVTSEIKNIKVEKIEVAEREKYQAIVMLVRNDTDVTVKVFETRVCYSSGCRTGYLTGRFIPHVVSWSDEDREPVVRRIIGVTLRRIQTMED